MVVGIAERLYSVNVCDECVLVTVEMAERLYSVTVSDECVFCCST